MKAVNLKVLLIATALLTGCAADPRVDMFPEPLSDDKVATLLPFAPARGMALIRVDGNATGSCLTNCMFNRPVRVLPGTHRLSMELNLDNAMKPILSADQLEQAKAATNTGYSLISLIVASSRTEGQYAFEAGKRYRMEFAYKSVNDAAPYIWWEQIP